MTNSLMLASSHILLAGSISNTTENELIDRAHEFVDTFVEEVLKAGGGFVIYVAAEPVNGDNKPLLFDWTVAKAVDKLTPGDSSQVRLKNLWLRRSAFKPRRTMSSAGCSWA